MTGRTHERLLEVLGATLEADEAEERLTSSELGERTGQLPSQIRRDLMRVRLGGTRGMGYERATLIRVLTLRLSAEEAAALATLADQRARRMARAAHHVLGEASDVR